jgi:hypothetical protein
VLLPRRKEHINSKHTIILARQNKSREKRSVMTLSQSQSKVILKTTGEINQRGKIRWRANWDVTARTGRGLARKKTNNDFTLEIRKQAEITTEGRRNELRRREFEEPKLTDE